MNTQPTWTEPVILEAWVSKYGTRPDELPNMNAERLAAAVFAQPIGSKPPEGWTHVSQMRVSVALFPPADLTQRSIDALQTQKTTVLARAHAEATRIEGEIQKLLAIGNEVQA